ncbi:MAG: hypothetical protein V7676_01615 [Parasphingorhabdus sp.]|uniref:hypothetical protein n=1 Tax=Parasphingorhabdus sp. TaxID=2709688 RepID=UPI0030029A94
MTDQTLDKHIDRARRFLMMQRKRSLFFPNNAIFGDPAWELLLEIYIATEKHQCVSKAALFAGLSTTPAIASRWISVFIENDYVTICEKHSTDCICLTDDARAECIGYLDAIADF